MIVDPIGACRHCISADEIGGRLHCTDTHVRGCGAPVLPLVKRIAAVSSRPGSVSMMTRAGAVVGAIWTPP